MKTTLLILLTLALPALALDPTQPAALVRDGVVVQKWETGIPTRTRHVAYNGSLRLLPTERLLAMGWRQWVKAEQPAEGYEVESVATTITDTQVIDTATFRIIEEGDAARYAERVAAITPELWKQAAMFRVAIRKLYGESAETNTNVTEAVVEYDFQTRFHADTLTGSEVASYTILQQFFPLILAWTGTDNIWTFPWAMIPEN